MTVYVCNSLINVNKLAHKGEAILFNCIFKVLIENAYNVLFGEKATSL